MLWDTQVGKWDTMAFQESMFISLLAAAKWIHVQRLSPKSKQVSPYILSKQVTEAKRQGLPIYGCT
jgi:hypothetical protein